METNNDFKINRERVLQLDITGYYQYLCNIGNLFKEYIEVDNINNAICAKWLDNGGLLSEKMPEFKHNPNKDEVERIAIYLLAFDEKRETTKEINYHSLYIRIKNNILILKNMVDTSQEIEAENFSCSRFDLAATETAIKEYETLDYYILPHICKGKPDPRILDADNATLLGIEIGNLITYRELSANLMGKTIPPDMQTAVERLKVLYEYFKEDTAKIELQTNRSKSKILAQILGVSSETIRPHLKKLTLGKL